MSSPGLSGRVVVVFGVANRRSVAFRIVQRLIDEGATVVCGVHTLARVEQVQKLLPGCEVLACDLERDDQIATFAKQVRGKHPTIQGLVHSAAFANYENFSGRFHEVSRKDFLQCVSVSCYSLTALAKAFQDAFDRKASVVTISISTTTMAAESYGFMAPAKAALDSSLAFLAKSFSRFSEVRFNAVCAGLLKTNSSAGIPGYADNFLFAEAATLRKRAVTTEEVAETALFLLSDRSSGINAQGLIVDAGMGVNYFDADIVRHALKGLWPTGPS